MSNPHDLTFKKLMQHRKFFLGFFKHYLPKEIYESIDWSTSKIFKISGEHIREIFPIDPKKVKLIQNIGDLAYIVQKKASPKKALIYLHAEHQSTPDRFIPLRTAIYILGALYEYAKMHKTEPLPEVYSVIYYHGQKPYPHAQNIWNMFSENYDSRNFLFNPNFVDLTIQTNQELLEHTGIAAAELAFKHIFDSTHAHFIKDLAQSLKTTDGEIRTDVLKYIITMSDSDEEFLKELNAALPEEEIMTLGQRLEQKGFERGFEQAKTLGQRLEQKGFERGITTGIQEGRNQEAREIAKNMLLKGADLDFIKAVTGLQDEDLQKLTQNH